MVKLSRKKPVARLKKRIDFIHVAETRISYATPSLILQMRKHTKQETQSTFLAPLRLGFTVSKKVGKAVVRNRVKRRLKAVASILLPIQISSNCDYVIIGRQNAISRTFPGLISDLQNALDKVNFQQGSK